MPLELPSEIETQIRNAATAEGIPVDQFLREAVEARLKQNAFARASAETPLSDTALLARINTGFSEEFWNRFRYLTSRRDMGTLTSEEQTELIDLSDTMEARQVERLHDLTELAHRRGTTVRSLMQDMGIKPVRVS